MPKKRSLILYGLFAFCTVYSMTPAVAGFQWVAPDNATYGNSYPQPVTNSAVATGSPEVISPVIITGDNASANSMQRQPLTQTQNMAPPLATQSSMTQPSPDRPTSLATATITVPGNSNAVVQGFASQIPLPLALRQILPPGYSFSIDQNVDMETLVSYKGGRNWRDTLGDMLTAVGLTAREQGGTITVSRATAPSQAAQNPVSLAPSVPLDVPVASSARAPMGGDGIISHNGDLPSVNVGSADGWSAQRGDTLHKVLSEWCRRAGVELQWQAEYDYPMEASVGFNGDFEDAVRSLLAGFENASPQPVAELHANSSASQKVLIVQARGNNYSN